MEKDTLANIEGAILTIRGQRVILYQDLARLYGISTKRLNEQVKRNRERFPEDFMFQLEVQDVVSLRSQFATSNAPKGGRRLGFSSSKANLIFSPKASDPYP